MHRRLLQTLILMTSASLITACAPTRQVPEVLVEKNGLQQPAKPHGNPSDIRSWELSGALAAKNQNKAWTASLNWLQQGQNQYQIRLFGPLGSGTILIEKQGTEIRFIDGKKTLSSHDADQLFEQQTGIRLPVQNLYYWVRGLPAPGPVSAKQVDPESRLLTLTQSGYRIDYANYTDTNQYALPGKIQLQGHGVVIKLVIKRWTCNI